MKTKKQIQDVIEVFIDRINRAKKLGEYNTRLQYPDPIEESANKILALLWAIDEIDDIYQYANTPAKMNLDLLCLNVLNEINKENKEKKMEEIKEQAKTVQGFLDNWFCEPDKEGLKAVKKEVQKLIKKIDKLLIELS